YGWVKVRVQYRKQAITLSRRQWEELLYGLQAYLRCFPMLDITRRTVSFCHPTRPYFPETREGEMLNCLEHAFFCLRSEVYEGEDELAWQTGGDRWVLPHYSVRDFGAFCGKAALAGFFDLQRIPPDIILKILVLCDTGRELVVTDDPTQVPAKARAQATIVSHRKRVRQRDRKRPSLSLVHDAGTRQ
ncbi:MAG: hypothetical protein AB1664_18605, partial [Thermodesulfobacteriota bacterium]